MSAASNLIRMLATSVAIAASVAAPSAHAITATVNDLISTRDGVLHFLDSFDDGVAPPNSPNFANGSPHAYYIGAGVVPVGAESGGKLTLDSSLGGSTKIADGTPSLTQRLTVISNQNPAITTSGLKPNHTFAVSALVDIAGASGPGSIQVRLVDRALLAGDFSYSIEESVAIGFASTEGTVFFRRQDFFAHTVHEISSISIPTAADQVRMMLLRPDATSNQVFAAAEFFDDGGSLGIYALPGSSSIFNYRGFTRLELAAGELAPVPEPGAYAMMMVGIGLIGWHLRRLTRSRRRLRLAC